MATTPIGVIMLVAGIVLAFVVGGSLPPILGVVGFAMIFIGLDLGKLKDRLDKQATAPEPAKAETKPAQ